MEFCSTRAKQHFKHVLIYCISILYSPKLQCVNCGFILDCVASCSAVLLHSGINTYDKVLKLILEAELTIH